MARRTQSRFDRCVSAVSKRGTARDPRAVCGAMEKRTKQNVWPFFSHATSGRQTMPASARSAGALGIGERKRGTRTKATQYKGVSIFQSGDTFGTSLDSSTFDTLADARRFVTAWTKRNPGVIARLKRAKVEKRTGKALRKLVRGNPLIPAAAADALAGYAGYQAAGDVIGATGKFLLKQAKRNPKRRNPADASVAAYEEFHGKQPDEFVEITERVHYHQHLSGAGELRKLIVAAVDGRHIVTLSQFKGALLAFNERKNQLFVKGGDQAVDPKDFGIDPRKAHELETLGRVKSIDYKTDKRHLGDEGGKATYRHKFRTTNEDGRHVTIRIARYPDLIYRVRDKALEFSGGSYEIIAEGIDR